MWWNRSILKESEAQKVIGKSEKNPGSSNHCRQWLSIVLPTFLFPSREPWQARVRDENRLPEIDARITFLCGDRYFFHILRILKAHEARVTDIYSCLCDNHKSCVRYEASTKPSTRLQIFLRAAVYIKRKVLPFFSNKWLLSSVTWLYTQWKRNVIWKMTEKSWRKTFYLNKVLILKHNFKI